LGLFGMLVPLNIRNSIYEYLLNEGVMTAVEDVRPKCIHPAIKVRNLYVMNVMKSLVSRGYVKKRFAWRTFYWFLTNEGIDYLREVLHLPTEIVPATLNKPSIESRFPGPRGPVGGPRMQTDGRSAYRIGTVGQADATKEATVVPEGEVHFRGGPDGRPM
uniref:S10_plectin domain-containing protein n=1 Tax=Taenia asiatica TaxID=60517 RepID=A0A0R3W6M1_TAEAS